jgi:effector-binding domain-containing protein
MPVDEVRQVLAAPDLETRNELIAAHLNRLEEGLNRTQDAVGSLRDLLARPAPPGLADIGRLRVDATPAAAISEAVDIEEAGPWYQGALGELYAAIEAQNLSPDGPSGGIFATELFSRGLGQATLFVPCTGPLRSMGRVTSLVVPPAEFATIVHPGPHTDVDRAYGSLATYVTEHALAVEGPIREYYLTYRHDTPDSSQWRTQICWPIFHTGPAPDAP